MDFFPTDCIPEPGQKSCDVSLGSMDPMDDIDFGSCSYNGMLLYGKVQFVENFPDIKIQIVSDFPDIKVEMVTQFPDECGQWQEVQNFPDIKVQLVDQFPDIKVQMVDDFPGKP